MTDTLLIEPPDPFDHWASRYAQRGCRVIYEWRPEFFHSFEDAEEWLRGNADGHDGDDLACDEARRAHGLTPRRLW